MRSEPYFHYSIQELEEKLEKLNERHRKTTNILAGIELKQRQITEAINNKKA